MWQQRASSVHVPACGRDEARSHLARSCWSVASSAAMTLLRSSIKMRQRSSRDVAESDASKPLV
jgi:hypothetical protein